MTIRKPDITPSASISDDAWGDAATLPTHRVFGEPYEVHGVTIIPAAKMSSPRRRGRQPARAEPAGVYRISDGDVAWIPAHDVGALVRSGLVFAAIATICITLVTITRRR
jgi:hypothetical protein